MRRGLPLLLLAWLTAPIPAAGDGVALEYAVRYGPLEVVTMRTTARFDGARYETTSELRTVGVIGMLFPWTSGASTAGWRDAAGLRPEWHRSRGEYRGTIRTVSIDYSDAGVRSAVHPPAEDDHRDPVPIADQQQTIDPLTASLATATAGCRGALRVFDGRRRYDLVLSDLGETELPAPTPVFRGASRHCRARVAPVAGFWRAEERHDERPAQLDVWIASPPPAGFALPVYMELSAPRGTLTIALRALEASP